MIWLFEFSRQPQKESLSSSFFQPLSNFPTKIKKFGRKIKWPTFFFSFSLFQFFFFQEFLSSRENDGLSFISESEKCTQRRKRRKLFNSRKDEEGKIQMRTDLGGPTEVGPC